MNIDVLYTIRNNPTLFNYLKYHSYWYKYLKRNPKSIKVMIEEAKKFYNLTLEDRINDLNNKVNLLSSLLKTIN